MGRALDIELRVIPSRIANSFVDRVHYSGKHVNNSQLHFGAFLDGRLHGVMSFGPPMDKSKVIGLVEGTGWNQMIELNRMAFDEVLPRNSESHCISLAMKLLKKNAPHIKWVLSFADGCSCGDGTIYRASNFILTGIGKNTTVARLPDGTEITNIAFGTTKYSPRPELGGKSVAEYFGRVSVGFQEYLDAVGGKMSEGYMLRYIYFIDPKWRKRLTVPELPFSAIADAGAGMYRGVRR
jgi:hypothetical protein